MHSCSNFIFFSSIYRITSLNSFSSPNFSRRFYLFLSIFSIYCEYCSSVSRSIRKLFKWNFCFYVNPENKKSLRHLCPQNDNILQQELHHKSFGAVFFVPCYGILPGKQRRLFSSWYLKEVRFFNSYYLLYSAEIRETNVSISSPRNSNSLL